MNEFNQMNPMMGTYGTAAPGAACASMPQPNMMQMLWQMMSQMMSQMMPQMMMGQMNSAQMQQMSAPQSQTPTTQVPQEADEHKAAEGKALNDDDGIGRMLTVKEVCEALHVDPSTLWRWNRDGVLCRCKVGKFRVLYREKDVMDFVNNK